MPAAVGGLDSALVHIAIGPGQKAHRLSGDLLEVGPVLGDLRDLVFVVQPAEGDVGDGVGFDGAPLRQRPNLAPGQRGDVVDKVGADQTVPVEDPGERPGTGVTIVIRQDHGVGGRSARPRAARQNWRKVIDV